MEVFILILLCVGALIGFIGWAIDNRQQKKKFAFDYLRALDKQTKKEKSLIEIELKIIEVLNSEPYPLSEKEIIDRLYPNFSLTSSQLQKKIMRLKCYGKVEETILMNKKFYKLFKSDFGF